MSPLEQRRTRTRPAAGLYASQVLGSLNLSGSYQLSTDANAKDARTLAVGGTYGSSDGKVYVGYLDSKRDAGFAAGANLSGTSLANTSLMPAFNTLTLAGVAGTVTASRHDQLFVVGANRFFATYFNVIEGFMHDRISGTTQGAVNQSVSGSRNSIYGAVQYFLSKRTDLYLEVDYNKLKDDNAANGITGTGLNYNGFDSRTGLAVGMRHAF